MHCSHVVKLIRFDSIRVRWGFTLKSGYDWEFTKFNPDSPWEGKFDVDYGVDGTGDIYSNANIRHFAELVDERTRGKGVHLFTADGVRARDRLAHSARNDASVRDTDR